KADAAVTNPANPGSTIALLKGIITQLQTATTGTAVTIADGAAVTLGAKADAAITNPATAGSVIAFLKGMLTQLQAAIPAGANVIGGVTIADGSDVTQGAKADAAITNPATSGSV